MELVLVVFLLYGVQCVHWLPRGAVLFQRPLRAWHDTHGPGWRLEHPRPAAASIFAARLPVVEEEGRLHGRGGATWASHAPGRAPGPALSPGSGEEVDARGRVVRVDGRPLVGCASPEGAASLAPRIAALLARAGGEREWARAELERACSPQQFAQQQRRFAAATTSLAWLADAYVALLFLALPAAIATFGEERGILLALPPLAVVHVANLVALGVARRRLLGERASLAEALFSAALYPPLLLRGLPELRAAVLSGFHPALVASAVLPEEKARAFLRTEWLRAEARAQEPARFGIAAPEREALRALIESRGQSLEELLAPPPRRDASAPAFCPACRSDYRRTAGACSDCGVALVVYPEAGESDPTGERRVPLGNEASG